MGIRNLEVTRRPKSNPFDYHDHIEVGLMHSTDPKDFAPGGEHFVATMPEDLPERGVRADQAIVIEREHAPARVCQLTAMRSARADLNVKTWCVM